MLHTATRLQSLRTAETTRGVTLSSLGIGWLNATNLEKFEIWNKKHVVTHNVGRVKLTTHIPGLLGVDGGLVAEPELEPKLRFRKRLETPPGFWPLGLE